MKIKPFETALDSSRRVDQVALAAATLFCVTGLLGTGCSKKEATFVPTTGATKSPSEVPPGASKPTPEQEAAKQRAIQQGPAIEAALQAQQGK